MSKPNYAKWMGKELWTVIEAAYLLCDKEPLRDLRQFLKCLEAGKPEDVIDVYGDLKNAGIKKSLKLRDPRYGSYVGHQRVDPMPCIKWAVTRGIAVPDELKHLAGVTSAEGHSREGPESISPKERNQLLRIICVLASLAKLPPEPYKAGEIVAKHSQAIGMDLKGRSVGDKLKAAYSMKD